MRDEEVKELRKILELGNHFLHCVFDSEPLDDTIAVTGGSVYEAEKEVYSVVQVVKDFLRELPDPICSADLIPAWVEASSMPEAQFSFISRPLTSVHWMTEQPAPDTLRQELKRLIFLHLPEANRQVLHYLLAFLYLYGLAPSHTAKNKANVAQIAETFGPLILRVPTIAPETQLPPSPTMVTTPEATSSVPQTPSNALPVEVPETLKTEISQETARVIFQTLLENLMDMFPMLPTLCPSLTASPVFGVPLEEVMQNQATAHPSLGVPYCIQRGTFEGMKHCVHNLTTGLLVLSTRTLT